MAAAIFVVMWHQSDDSRELARSCDRYPQAREGGCALFQGRRADAAGHRLAHARRHELSAHRATGWPWLVRMGAGGPRPAGTATTGSTTAGSRVLRASCRSCGVSSCRSETRRSWGFHGSRGNGEQQDVDATAGWRQTARQKSRGRCVLDDVAPSTTPLSSAPVADRAPVLRTAAAADQTRRARRPFHDAAEAIVLEQSHRAAPNQIPGDRSPSHRRQTAA